MSLFVQDGIPPPAATSAYDLNDIVSWMKHRHRTPFCIPAASNPDLIFVLKLADGSFIWVVFQVTPEASDGSDLFACLEDDGLFRDEEHDPDASLHKRAMELLNAPPDSRCIKETLPDRSPCGCFVSAADYFEETCDQGGA
ncbi:hypothetical protein FB451DRAFT_1404526 [Mycena latifolia]|nr:hypothetical protein FB451DRAFT_1404526 [Mycena latifolia]